VWSVRKRRVKISRRRYTYTLSTTNLIWIALGLNAVLEVREVLSISKAKKLKQSHFTPRRLLEGEEV
jgi:hypothetical protein